MKNVRVLLTGGGITQYEKGDIDVTGVGLDDIERVQDPADPLNKDYHTGTQLSIDYIGFNTNSPPFDDPKVRQAFAMAVDKKQIAKAVFHDADPRRGQHRHARHARRTTPNITGAEVRPVTARSSCSQESKYGGAESCLDHARRKRHRRHRRRRHQRDRRDVAQEPRRRRADPAGGVRHVLPGRRRGRYQAFTLGWIMDYPDEEDLLNIHFDSESPNNDTFYNNPQVDDLLRAPSPSRTRRRASSSTSRPSRSS